MQKVCSKCGVAKILDDFYDVAKNTDGKCGRCKECCKKYRAQRYALVGNTKIKEYEQKRAQTPLRKAQQKAYATKRKHTKPMQWAANVMVGVAVRDGRLVKSPCAVCGEQKVEAHHHDYSRPLDVTWLCRKHHLAMHGKECWVP